MTTTAVAAVDTAASVGPTGHAVRDLARHSHRHLERWVAQVQRLRGCREPIRLTGETMRLDTRTGEVASRYTTADEPHGQLMVRCKNRRASRCPACAEEYRSDTFHLIRAGLSGSKGVPDTVATHPRVLATFTAPSFGPVHLGVPGPDGRPRPCYPRRTRPACWIRHAPDDPAIGQPIDPNGYDYPAQVLWNAHAGQLWRRLVTYLPRELAKAAGLTHRELADQVRISYAKVAEYQRRGVVHFHAVIRLDARTTTPGACEPPPAWATVDLLNHAIRAAAAAARLEVVAPTLDRTIPLTWGSQVDVQPIAAFGNGEPLTAEAVAGYIAKYATKATEATGALDRRVTGYDVATVHRRPDVPAHTAHLIRTCWQLGDNAAHPDLAALKLRRWCHMLGFRGHFTTKSRAYSTTLGALRQARADHRAHADGHRDGSELEETTLVLTHWRYAGQGYTPGESLLAASLTAPTTTAPRRNPKGGLT